MDDSDITIFTDGLKITLILGSILAIVIQATFLIEKKGIEFNKP